MDRKARFLQQQTQREREKLGFRQEARVSAGTEVSLQGVRVSGLETSYWLFGEGVQEVS